MVFAGRGATGAEPAEEQSAAMWFAHLGRQTRPLRQLARSSRLATPADSVVSVSSRRAPAAGMAAAGRPERHRLGVASRSQSSSSPAAATASAGSPGHCGSPAAIAGGAGRRGHTSGAAAPQRHPLHPGDRSSSSGSGRLGARKAGPVPDWVAATAAPDAMSSASVSAAVRVSAPARARGSPTGLNCGGLIEVLWITRSRRSRARPQAVEAHPASRVGE
jgi:hypothetical protein